MPIDGRELSWACPSEFGKGRFSKIHIRNGLDIWITDCCFEKEMVFSCLDHPDALIFSFYLSGHSISRLGPSKTDLTPTPGQQGIFFFPQPVGISRVQTRTQFRHIAIMVRPEQLGAYVEDDFDLLPLTLRKIVHGRSNDSFCQIRPITAPMISALEQILHCPYRGMTRRLYLESRAMALIAFQLDALTPDTGRESTGGILHPTDRRRMEQVRQMLIQDLENPLTSRP